MRFMSIFMLALFFSLIVSCKKDSNKELTIENSIEQFNEDFKLLAFEEPPEIVDPAKVISRDTTLINEVQCELITYFAAPGRIEAIIYAPFSDALFLGSVIDGASIHSAMKLIPASIAPITISISTEHIEGLPSITINEPNLANVREGIVTLLKQLGKTTTPSLMAFNSTRVYSKEQSKLAIGLEYGGFADVFFDWNKNTNSEYNKVLFDFTQLYYTLDLNLTHQTPGSYFKELPKIDVFQETKPAILTSIKYGRRIMFAVESSYSFEEVEAALTVAMSKFKQELEVSISKEHQEVIENSSIKAYVMGGNAVEGVKLIDGIDDLEDVLRSGAAYNFDSPGVPLTYQFRYLHDNSIATMVNTAEYQVRDCQVVGTPVSFVPFDGERLDFCPVLNEEEGSGRGIGLADVKGEVKLEIRNGNEIWALTNLKIKEIGDNNTTAIVNDERRVYRAKAGEHIQTINSNPVTYFSYTDNDREPEFSSLDFQLDSDFIRKVEIAGVAGSKSLPCTGYQSHLTGDGRSYLALWFDEVIITTLKD